MKQILKIAAGIIVGSAATTGLTLVFYKPIMKKLLRINEEIANDFIDTED